MNDERNDGFLNEQKPAENTSPTPSAPENPSSPAPENKTPTPPQGQWQGNGDSFGKAAPGYGSASWGQENFGGGQGPKKPKKSGTTVLVVTLMVLLYVGLVAGLLGMIATGTLRMDLEGNREESGEAVTDKTKEEEKEKEKETNAPILQNPSTDGENVIVGEDYTGQALSASDLYERNAECVVFVEANYRNGKGTGSGFVIDSENGYILTNYHVVEDCTDIAVTFKNSDSYTAKLVGGDEINDVAVLKVEAKGLKHVTVGNSEKLRVGEDVLIIGNPLGDLTFTLTKGIVSAVNRTINTGEYNIVTFQTDTAINSGNSGGPAFDSTGAVIGIASAKYSASGVEGIGFCIPINDAMRIANDLVNHGYVTGRPNFGITVSDSVGYEYITDSYGRRVRVETALGARIEAVGKGSCAEKAGLKVGDIVTKLGDVKIETANALINAKNTYKAGKTASLEVYRNGETVTLQVTFDEYIPQD